ncbi:DUF2142 domain-containing protein [Actinotalea sp. BY-33]|uniref:DUF2142 domain-containing protein n=1 Tax=Actinotalea soli TaxID=2819234 RepID=A0A939LTA8_9CELL|nr:glycosyltransferase family 39 protein [Actinotalea soli]MBO1750947.1 DUF2142 domain-containing protein [Actinotalea soli]
MISVAWLAVLLAWSVTLPTYRSADEVLHVSATISLRETLEWPGFKELPALREVMDSRDAAGMFNEDREYYPLAAADAVPRPERPPFTTDGTFTGFGINNLGQHPPGYYTLTGVVSALTPSTTPFDLQVWLLRLVNVLLVAPLPWIFAGIARTFRADRAAVAVAALTPLLIPQLGALGGAVNNENLAILTGAGMSLLIARVAVGDLRARTALLLGLVLGVGMLTKAWSLLFVPVIALAYVVAGFRTRRWGRAAGGLAVAGLLSCIGAWWWVRNYLVFGAVQPAGHLPAREGGPLGRREGLPDFVDAAADLLPTRFWATLSLKYGDDPFSPALTGALTVLLALLMVVFLLRRRSFEARRIDAFLLVAPFAAALLVLLSSTFSLYLVTGAARGLQGRYLYTGLAAVAACVALGLLGLLRPALRRAVAILLSVLGGWFTLASLARALEGHWAGDDLLDRMTSLTAWSPLPPILSAGFVVLAGAALVVMVIVLGVVLVRREPPPPLDAEKEVL